MPADITESVLEENIYKALPLTGVNVVPNDLHACHKMKRTDITDIENILEIDNLGEIH